MANCDLFSPILTWSETRAHVAELLAPQDYKTAIESGASSRKIREVFAHIPDESKYVNAVLSHERDHLYRSLSTTYGLMARSFFDFVYDVATGLMEIASREKQKFAFPLVTKHNELIDAYLRDPDPTHTSPVRSLALNGALAGASLSAFLHAIEWNDLKNARNARYKGLVASFARLLPLQGLGEIDPDSITLGTPANGLQVNARGLVEHMAMLETYSMSSLHAIEPGYVRKRLIRTHGSDEYTSVASAWGANHRMRFNGPYEVRDDDWMSSTYAVFPVEHYAVVDLALMPPYLPEGFPAGRVWKWSDIEPGQRFWRASNWLIERGEAYTPLASGDREKRFIQIQQAICDDLAWPTPIALAKQWLDALGSSHFRPGERFVAFPEDITFRYARTLLQKRIDSPFAFVVNNMDWELHREVDFVGWITKEADGLRLNAATDTSANSTLRTYLLQRTVNCLMFGDSHFLRHAPEHLKEAAVLLSSQLFDAGWDGDYLLREINETFGISPRKRGWR